MSTADGRIPDPKTSSAMTEHAKSSNLQHVGSEPPTSPPCPSTDPTYPSPPDPTSHPASPCSRPQAAPRNIILLLDGTGNQFSSTNSNVLKMRSVLAADEDQLLYYSSGVGTVLPEHASTWGKARSKVAQWTDMAVAWNHQSFLCNAYKYLMDFYRDGDKVMIFGFSRGAYTARALAGMIEKVGLLPAGNYSLVQAAYDIYRSPDAPRRANWMKKFAEVAARAKDRMFKSGHTSPVEGDSSGEMEPAIDNPATEFRLIFGISRCVEVHFVGVWDTVSSMGGIYLPHLPHAGKVESVRFFRHALALDERRVRFAPEFRQTEQGIAIEPGRWRSVLDRAQKAIETSTHADALREAIANGRTHLEEAEAAEQPENSWSGDCGPMPAAERRALLERALDALDILENDGSSGEESARARQELINTIDSRCLSSLNFVLLDPADRVRLLNQALAAAKVIDACPSAGDTDTTSEVKLRRARRDLDEAMLSGCIAPVHAIPAVACGEKPRFCETNKEVWFMGSHSDVGGGNVLNGKPSLSNVPFRYASPV